MESNKYKLSLENFYQKDESGEGSDSEYLIHNILIIIELNFWENFVFKCIISVISDIYDDYFILFYIKH